MKKYIAKKLRELADKLDPVELSPPPVHIDFRDVPPEVFMRELRRMVRISGGIQNCFGPHYGP